MKKSIVLGLFLCLALSVSAYAQNGAVVNPRGIEFEDAPDGLVLTSDEGVWTGLVTSVITPSGNAHLNWTGKLVEGSGDGYGNKKPEIVFEGTALLFGAVYDVSIKMTPSQVAILKAVQVE